jgi:hypothetical protein
MTVFEDAVNARYADVNTTVDALYKAQGIGSGVSVRLKIGRPDEEVTLGRSRVRLETTIGRARVSQVPGLKIGDTFSVGGATFKVASKDRGPKRLEWVMDFEEVRV